VLYLEVLVCKFLAVDRFPTGALQNSSQTSPVFGVNECSAGTHITAGEVTTLQHELRDDAVELGSSVAEALLAGAEGTEVFSGSGNNIVVKDEVDTTGLF